MPKTIPFDQPKTIPFGNQPSAAAPTPQQQSLPSQIWASLATRTENVRREITSGGNPVTSGIRATGEAFSGLSDVAGAVINSNPLTKAAAQTVAAPIKAGFDFTVDKISNTKLFREAVADPEATKTLEDYLSAGKSLGDIANNILLAEGARAGAVQAKSSATAAFNQLTARTEESINRAVIKNYEKGVKPLLSGRTTPTKVAEYRQDVVQAVNTIRASKQSLQFTDDAGEIIAGQTPKSLQQFSEAIEQTKKIVFNNYDDLAKRAGQAGLKIKSDPVAAELDTVIGNKALALTNPDAIKYAQQWKERLTTTGELNATDAQDVIQQLNKNLDAFWKNPSYDSASKASIDALVANRFRTSLDEGVNALTGQQYGAVKAQYGALKAVERDVIKAALRDARKNFKGLVDFTDIFSGGQVVNGILNLNPAQVASGIAQKAIAEYIKHVNNPNRAIEAMFKNAEKTPTR